MGTFVAIQAEADDATAVDTALARAFGAVAQVEALMHPWRDGSDLRAIHDADTGKPLRIHPWTWDVLDLCRRMHALSGGRFDPCVPDAAGRLRDLQLVDAPFVIRHAPMRLDLGGIAKGYAVDRAIAALRESGCEHALVNAGGDLRVFGARGHDIVCRSPPGPGRVVHLRDRALAASDAGVAERPREHRGYYHGVDRTSVVSGSVVIGAPSAAVADALTKCVLTDRDGSADLLAAFGAERID